MNKNIKNVDMTNEEYRKKLQNLFEMVDNNKLLRYFYIYALEKIKRVQN